MTLDTRFELKVLAELSNTLDLATARAPLSLLKDVLLSDGTGANQADKIFADTRTIAASATDSLDLAGGGLTDLLGAALTLAKLKAIYIAAAAENTNHVVLTRPAANGVPLFSGAGDALPVLPGGVALWIAPNAAGVAVTAGTGDLIDLINSAAGSTVTYDIVIIGTSA